MSRQVVETLIARQLHQYNRLRSLLREEPVDRPAVHGPVVTISRQSGCCARQLAGRLATRLEVQVWGRELVDLVATDEGLRRELVSRLDAGAVRDTDTWVHGVISGRIFTQSDYLMALARTLKVLADSGGAVVVGRGASFILGDRAQLRLRLVAGRLHRVRTLVRERGIERTEAELLLDRLDQGRRDFVQQHFHRDVNDPQHYDLVVNVERVSADVLVDTCVSLVESRRSRADAAEG